MWNKEQGRARTGGDVEEERVGGRRHVLPEEGEPHNHLQERTAQDRARPTGGAATAAQESEGLQSVGGRVWWKDKRTTGPKNIKWWKCKDEMMVEYRDNIWRRYEELDAEKGTVEVEWRTYKDAFVGVAEELCGRTSGKGRTPRSRNQG